MQSGQALMEPEPEPGVEELWEQEMERLWSSQAQVRELPYAMVDKRFIRWVPPHPPRLGRTRWRPDGGGGRGTTQRMHRWDGVEVTSRGKTPLAPGIALPGPVGTAGDSRTPHHHPNPGSCGSPRG